MAKRRSLENSTPIVTQSSYAPSGRYSLITASHTLPEVVITGKDRSKSTLGRIWDAIKNADLAYIDNPSVMTAAGHTAKISEMHKPTEDERALGNTLAGIGLAGTVGLAAPIVLPYIAPGSAFWMNPLTQQMMAGTAMSEGVNLGTKVLTGRDSFGQLVGDAVEDVSGWNPNTTWWGPIVTEALNPGWYRNPNSVMNTVGRVGSTAETIANKALLNTVQRNALGKPVMPEGLFKLPSTTRTRVGDVEINNPNLLYHLDRGDRAGAFSNQGAYVKNGFLYPGPPKDATATPYSWWNLGKPYSTHVGGEPMTRLMTATRDTPGMLHVRSQEYPIGQWNGRRGFVTNAEYVNSKGVDVSGSTYTLDPNYGWRKTFAEEAPAAEWPINGIAPEITAENAASITPAQWTAAQDAAIAKFEIPSFNLNIDALRADIERKIIENQWKGLLRGEDDVFNYLGSERHINRIMESGVSRERATRIAQDMRDNAMATDRAIDYTGGEGAYHNVGEYDNGFFDNHRLTLNPRYTVMKGLDEQTTYENVIHELGGHGATLGYKPGSYSNISERAAKWYEDAMTEWSPYHKEVYEHNSSLKPVRKPEYEGVKDPHIEYLEGVDEYSTRARAANIDSNGSNRGDFSELYKYFTKESVDKLKNGVWGLVPFIGLGTLGTMYGVSNKRSLENNGYK